MVEIVEDRKRELEELLREANMLADAGIIPARVSPDLAPAVADYLRRARLLLSNLAELATQAKIKIERVEELPDWMLSAEEREIDSLIAQIRVGVSWLEEARERLEEAIEAEREFRVKLNFNQPIFERGGG